MTRGFEDLVREESLLPAAQGPLTPTQDLQRVDSLEHRVRITMDRLTELVEAQLPEAVDGLRADVEELRTELRQALADASAALAEERFQLRSQIATTVGAANRWFVRTRDQLFERLDQVAQVASAAQAEAEAAASAAVAAAVPIPPEAATWPEEPAAPVEESAEFEWDAGDLEPAVEPVVTADADMEAGTGMEAGGTEEGAPTAGYDYELEPPPVPTTIEVNLEAPELEVLLEPLREDMRELQGEISAMGAAVMALREDVEALGSRLPSRAGSPRLSPSQLKAIVAAVQSALPAPAPPRRSSAAPDTSTSRTTSAKRAPAKKTTTTKRAASTGAAAPPARRRTPTR